MAACRTCGAPIEWARTENGKSIPLDPDDVEGGNLAVVGRDGGGPHVVRYVGTDVGNRVTHFATCEHAAQHRRPRVAPAPLPLVDEAAEAEAVERADALEHYAAQHQEHRDHLVGRG